MNLVIFGSRTIGDFHNNKQYYGEITTDICNKLDLIYFTLERQSPTTVISGRAKGVDLIGEYWASLSNIPVDPYEPDWYPDGVYNKRAALERNTEMARISDYGIGFWDVRSTGTKHMINECLKYCKEVYVIQYEITQEKLI